MAKVKDLEWKITKMEQDFESQFKTFRTELMQSIKENSQNVSPSILDKLTNFEKNILDNLQTMKTEINEIKEEMHEIKEKNVYSSNKNNLIIYGISENIDENEESLVKKVLELTKLFLKIDLEANEINFCYRVGKKSDKNRPVIIGFVNRWKRNILYAVKKNLKGSKCFISEVLSTSVLNLYKAIKKVYLKNCWTFNNTIYVMEAGKKIIIKSRQDFKNLQRSVEYEEI